MVQIHSPRPFTPFKHLQPFPKRVRIRVSVGAQHSDEVSAL